MLSSFDKQRERERETGGDPCAGVHKGGQECTRVDRSAHGWTGVHKDGQEFTRIDRSAQGRKGMQKVGQE